MPPPLPRCSGRAHSPLKLTHPYQPSPKPLSGRSAHRPFRGLLSVHSRCGLHTRAVTKTVTRYPKASDISSPPCLLRLLPAGANRRVGLAPTGKRRLVTAHPHFRHLPNLATSNPNFDGVLDVADARTDGLARRVSRYVGREQPASHHHSMTSSARARIEGGTVKPSALAVFRFTTSWNVVGCCTGRSAGLSPFKILPV